MAVFFSMDDAAGFFCPSSSWCNMGHRLTPPAWRPTVRRYTALLHFLPYAAVPLKARTCPTTRRGGCAAYDANRGTYYILLEGGIPRPGYANTGITLVPGCVSAPLLYPQAQPPCLLAHLHLHCCSGITFLYPAIETPHLLWSRVAPAPPPPFPTRPPPAHHLPRAGLL